MAGTMSGAPLGIGNLIALVPFIGWILQVVGGIVNLVEMLAVLLDPQGRRIGDRWAGTQVVALAQSAGPEGDNRCVSADPKDKRGWFRQAC